MDIRMIKNILRLKYQGGLSHERIVQSLAIYKGAVAKYLKRGRRRRARLPIDGRARRGLARAPTDGRRGSQRWPAR